jgi:hypothetical protein
MTTGALIFAYNNGVTDYVRMAAWTAKNIRRHLGIPVAVVTDQPTAYNFDKVVLCEATSTNERWFDDYAARVPWHNANRVNAYELSPWDTTLVIDADYVVASDQLKVLFECDQEFLAHRWATDITGQDNFESLNYFGHCRMPMWWATVMMFRRSTQARLIFETMHMIKNNWSHYRHIYKNFSNNLSQRSRTDHSTGRGKRTHTGSCANSVEVIYLDAVTQINSVGSRSISHRFYYSRQSTTMD